MNFVARSDFSELGDTLIVLCVCAGANMLGWSCDRTKINTNIQPSLTSMKSWRSFYKGYASTIAREIPFSVIQFPLWENGKIFAASYSSDGKCPPLASAACGSLSGAFAAAVTTPMDVVKTRLMTSPDVYSGIISTMVKIQKEEGTRALFRGIEPRVMWIGIGGFVFFGAYEESRKFISFVIGQ